MKRLFRSERDPGQNKEIISPKGYAAILLMTAAGLAGVLRADKISEVKDRIDYAASQAKVERQIAVDLKKLKCEDTQDANHPAFSRSEAKIIRRGVNQKDEGIFWVAGGNYQYRTGRSDAWAHPVLVGSGSFPFERRLDKTYINALVDTVEQTRQLDLDSTQPDEEGKLPIQHFREAYARNAQEELASDIQQANHRTANQLMHIYDMEQGYVPIPGVDFVLSGGELPGIGQLSDKTAQAAGVDIQAYDMYDEVIGGVAFDPVKPECN